MLRRFLFALLALTGGLLLPGAGRVQPGAAAPRAAVAGAADAAPATGAASATPAAPAAVRVTAAYALAKHRRDTLQLGDQVVLRAVGIHWALKRYGRKPDELRLYVDGVLFPMKPVSVDTLRRADTATVRFQLLRDPSTEPTWQLFYQVKSKLVHPAHLGLGFENGQLGEAFPAGREGIYLELVRESELNVGMAAVGLLLLLLLYLGWRSNLVRSDILRGHTDPATPLGLINEGYGDIPFSLSKVQLVFWTFLIFSAYLLCYLVTGELTTLPADLLGLLGISLGANVVSRTLTQDQVESKGPLQKTECSAGFWRDILAEGDRFSLARIQFLLFNLLVGLYFVRHVWKFWNLPDLADGLLPLISISSAGFLFGKFQEYPAAATKAAGGAGGAGAEATTTTTTAVAPLAAAVPEAAGAIVTTTTTTATPGLADG